MGKEGQGSSFFAKGLVGGALLLAAYQGELFSFNHVDLGSVGGVSQPFTADMAMGGKPILNLNNGLNLGVEGYVTTLTPRLIQPSNTMSEVGIGIGNLNIVGVGLTQNGLLDRDKGMYTRGNLRLLGWRR